MDDANVVLERSVLIKQNRPLRGEISPRRCIVTLIVLDVLIVCISAWLAYLANRASGQATEYASSIREILILAFAVPVAGLSLWWQGAYAIDGNCCRLSAIAVGWLNASAVILLAACLVDTLGIGAGSGGGPLLNPVSAISFAGIGGAGLLARAALWSALAPRIALQIGGTAAVVAGSGATCSKFLESLRKSQRTKAVAVVSDLESRSDEVVALARSGVVRTVFIVLPPSQFDTAQPLMARLAALPIAVRLVPDISGIASSQISVEAGYPVFHVSDPPLNPTAAFVKRAEDILFASLLLLLTAPVMLLAAIAIALESRGPVFFRQPRHGLNGAEIETFKFRTMYCEFEDRLASRQTVRGDPRVTGVGAVLRRHSLDELPQLFNVLGGTMSLVGPRPHAPATTAAGQDLERAVTNYMARHRVKPGITGWAQVSGCRGNLDSVEKAVRRVQHDLYYIENWSLLFDLRIIFRTIRVVVHDKDAF